MRATWYVLRDGTAVDPADCANVEGTLTHKDGGAIAMRGPGWPMTRGVDLDAKPKAKTDHHEKSDDEARDMQASPHKQGYKTRQTKTR